MKHSAFPPEQGLYDSDKEQDSCGIGFIVNIKGHKNHEIINQGLEILKNLTHRGAVGADPLAGDGAGLLIQTPDAFLREECQASFATPLPSIGDYGVGMIFLPRADSNRAACEKLIERVIAEEGQTLLGWRDVPTNNEGLGESVKTIEPVVRQVFIGKGNNCANQDAFERKLFVIRKVIEQGRRA
jgi:glutamate synthase (NADPH/NADH) large chain